MFSVRLIALYPSLTSGALCPQLTPVLIRRISISACSGNHVCLFFLKPFPTWTTASKYSSSEIVHYWCYVHTIVILQSLNHWHFKPVTSHLCSAYSYTKSQVLN